MTSKKIGNYRVYLTTFGRTGSNYEVAVKNLTSDEWLIILPYAGHYNKEALEDYKRMNSVSRIKQWIASKERY